LPHRPPFRFITNVCELQAGERGRAEWRIIGDEGFLQGHFPNQPIVPGVLIVEALAQFSGVVGLRQEAADKPSRVGGRLAHVDVRFDATVVPPAVIELHTNLRRVFGSLHLFDVRAVVDGQTVARGSLTLAGVVDP
jgi:3-hydroxyacyl-[acyl-carrier-protein] dehydratase